MTATCSVRLVKMETLLAIDELLSTLLLIVLFILEPKLLVKHLLLGKHFLSIHIARTYLYGSKVELVHFCCITLIFSKT